MEILEEIEDFLSRGYTKEQICQITGYNLEVKSNEKIKQKYL